MPFQAHCIITICDLYDCLCTYTGAGSQASGLHSSMGMGHAQLCPTFKGQGWRWCM
jgi:hypothetical protein